MRKKKIKTITGVLITIALICCFGAGIHFFEKMTNAKPDGFLKNKNDYIYLSDHNYEITHDIDSYLLIGSDNSGKSGKEYRGNLADFLLLAVFDKTDKTYGFLQIDRDTITRVEMPEGGEESEEDTFEQICTASWYGENPEEGCENTVDAVSELLGYMPIDGYYSINMKDIGKLNHAVGGVTVTLEDDFTNKDPEMEEGKTMKLSDKQAEYFVRSRMDIGDGENTSRMRRQREYMDAYLDSVKSEISKDNDFVNDLYAEFKENVVTDIPQSRISGIANRMNKDKYLGTFELSGEYKKGDTLGDGVKHTEFYPTTSSIIDTLCSLCSIEDRGVDKEQ